MEGNYCESRDCALSSICEGTNICMLTFMFLDDKGTEKWCQDSRKVRVSPITFFVV